MEIISFIVANGPAIFAGLVGMLLALVALLKAFIAIAVIIPGEQGEAVAQKIIDVLQKVVDFVGKPLK